MSISKFLKTPYSTITRGIKSTEHNSYIKIHNNLIILDYNYEDVVINKVLDINGNCSLYRGRSPRTITLNEIINVRYDIFIDRDINIIPGSFIGKQMMINGIHRHHMKGIIVQGYVMNYGVLS